jgi:spore germination protein PC
LDEEAPGEIQKLENKHHALLGSEYRQMMIEDVKRQIDDRIRIYLKRQPVGEGSEPRSVERNVVALLKSDIQTALHNYFKNLPERGVRDEHGSDQ